MYEEELVHSELLVKKLLLNTHQVTVHCFIKVMRDERFQSLGHDYYCGADGCVLAFSAKDIRSFQQLDNWREEFVIEAMPTDPDNFPFFVVCFDMYSAPQAEIAVSRSKVDSWARAQTVPVAVLYLEDTYYCDGCVTPDEMVGSMVKQMMEHESEHDDRVEIYESETHESNACVACGRQFGWLRWPRACAKCKKPNFCRKCTR